MNISEYKKMIDKDNAFIKDEVNIDVASLSVPEMVFKYQQAIYEETMVLEFMEHEYDILFKRRWTYYLGKADPQEYKDESFDHKILRGDVQIFLKADEKLNLLRAKVKEQQLKLNLIEAHCKSIMSLSYNVGNAIRWKKFLSGDIG